MGLYSEEELAILVELEEEVRAADPIYSQVTLHQFISSSKGKGRKRKRLKEINLIRYGIQFHQPHRFDWYNASLDLLGRDDEEALRARVLGNQAYNLNMRRW